MLQDKNLVSIPFRVAAGFLLLIFLWGFLSEESSISEPLTTEYEHYKKTVDLNATVLNAGHGGQTHNAYTPWRKHAADRTGHLDTVSNPWRRASFFCLFVMHDV